MGLINNLQEQAVMRQKAQEYDQMLQQMKQKAQAEQAFQLGKEKGLAEMAQHAAALTAPNSNPYNPNIGVGPNGQPAPEFNLQRQELR